MGSISALAEVTCPTYWPYWTLKFLECSQDILENLHSWLYIFILVISLTLNALFWILLKSYLSIVLIKGRLLVTVVIPPYQIGLLSPWNSTPSHHCLKCQNIFYFSTLLTKFCFNNGCLYVFLYSETLNSLRVRRCFSFEFPVFIYSFLLPSLSPFINSNFHFMNIYYVSMMCQDGLGSKTSLAAALPEFAV